MEQTRGLRTAQLGSFPFSLACNHARPYKESHHENAFDRFRNQSCSTHRDWRRQPQIELLDGRVMLSTASPTVTGGWLRRRGTHSQQYFSGTITGRYRFIYVGEDHELQRT